MAFRADDYRDIRPEQCAGVGLKEESTARQSFQHTFDLGDIPKLRLAQDLAGPFQIDSIVVCRRQSHLLHGGGQCGIEHSLKRGEFGRGGKQLGGECLQCLIGKRRTQGVRQKGDVGGCRDFFAGQADEAVLDLTGTEKQHQQEAIISGSRDKNLTHLGIVRAGRCRDGSIGSRAGEQGAGAAQESVHFERQIFFAGTRKRTFIKRGSQHQMVHIKAVPEVRRNAPCTRMRLPQEAHLGQLRHLVADRRALDAPLMTRGQLFAAERLDRFHIVAYDRTEYLLFSFIEVHFVINSVPFLPEVVNKMLIDIRAIASNS